MTRMLSPRLSGGCATPAGRALLEAAIITPLLLLLTFAIVDFAAMLYVHLALQNGVAQATRFGVTGAVTGPGMSREDSIKAAMRTATPTLTLGDGAFTFSHLPPGSGVVGRRHRRRRSDVEKVTVDYTWTLMTPVLQAVLSERRDALHASSPS